MALKFEPKSEKELREANLAPEGDYDFEVLGATDEISKRSGNPMIKVKIGLYSGEAIRHHVYDYLLTNMGHKLRHFCDSTGLLSKYESGELSAEDCKGRAGKCRVKIKEDANGQYPDKNEIDDYIIRPAKPMATVAAKAEQQPPPESDDVPF